MGCFLLSFLLFPLTGFASLTVSYSNRLSLAIALLSQLLDVLRNSLGRSPLLQRHRGKSATHTIKPPPGGEGAGKENDSKERNSLLTQPRMLVIALAMLGSSLPAARASRKSRAAFSFCPALTISATRVAFTEPTANGLFAEV